MHLRLDHEDHRVVSESAVGSDELEHVGEARDGDAEIGLGEIAPSIEEEQAIAATDLKISEVRARIGKEARAKDDAVGRDFLPTLHDDGVFTKLADLVSDKIDVLPIEGRIIFVGDEDTLTSDGVIGSELPARFGIADLDKEEERGELLESLGEARVEDGEQASVIP